MSGQMSPNEGNNERDTTSTESDVHNYPGFNIQLKPILEAEEKYGPVFRRELFDAAYAAFLAIDDSEPDGQTSPEQQWRSWYLRTEATVLDIYGNEHKVLVPKYEAKHEVTTFEGEKRSRQMRRIWLYNELQQLGRSHGEDRDGLLLPFTFVSQDIKDKDCPLNELSHDLTAKRRVEKTWGTSKLNESITKFLQQHAGSTAQHVDQIICFGLGCPISASQQTDRTYHRSYVQHLAACTIRDIFARSQSGVAPTIFAQDPEYSTESIAYLSENFGMVVLSDPEGFRALNSNTFLITVSPNVPVRQIALGMTHESGGPAGMFCDAINTDGLECDGQFWATDSKVRTWLYTTCPSSPGLWKYKGRAICLEHNDKEEMNCFGDIGMYLKRREGRNVGDKEQGGGVQG
jgi:hypothetical protein